MLTNLLKVRKIVSEGFRWSVFVSQTKFVYLILLAGSSLWGFMIRLSCAKGDIFVLFSSAIFYLFVKNHQNHTPLSNGIYLITERFKTIWASRLKTLRGKKTTRPSNICYDFAVPSKICSDFAATKNLLRNFAGPKTWATSGGHKTFVETFLDRKISGPFRNKLYLRKVKNWLQWIFVV